mmetsp:Transcript_24235/g.53816  ORF Transcript_24235/g.53816 Transcript_24235/m.53816 type:complete len:322 (-) Transcript_24235:168-1133(-)
MAPPLADVLPEDAFACGICTELALSPVTLTCCGRSFCRECLHRCLHQAAVQGVLPDCPRGCGSKVPSRLPATSKMIEEAIEALFPEELERRRAEAGEDEESEETPGNFSVGDEIVASRNLMIGSDIVASFGTRGAVVATRAVPGRLSVKFDENTDGTRRCIHVLPNEVMHQLPPAYRVCIAQRVFAVRDLVCGDQVIVRFGVQGTVLGPHPPNRIMVQFDTRADGNDNGLRRPGAVNVTQDEIQPWRVLSGGFWPGARVKASRCLYANDRIIVNDGVTGIVRQEFSETRLTVQFDQRADGSDAMVNVTAAEIAKVTDDDQN